jgi:hypothetical protein
MWNDLIRLPQTAADNTANAISIGFGKSVAVVQGI